jgi:hypothetical protein
MEQRNREHDLVPVTRGQLVSWAARIARLAWSTEDDVSHNVAVSLATEMKDSADG